MKNYFLALMMPLLIACTPKNHDMGGDAPCCDFVEEIYLQPYNGFSDAEVERLAAELPNFWGVPCNIYLGENINLGDEFKNGNRYSANKILDSMRKRAKKDVTYIGLIHDDIEADECRGVKHWGVQGLSYLDRNVAVASTYRVKNKADFWKVVYHEYLHASAGLPHCVADDPTCIMQDGHGHPNFKVKDGHVCEKCLDAMYERN